nr:PREDICTED: V-set domain-containing T-cell activation inhibitor 1-like [Latimeria chalumnae]|eukprot:XP_014354193.1 PREDICTED: V-set domain-containing T-cell activation inhibitor 1-like [Latimeria chalumnae]
MEDVRVGLKLKSICDALFIFTAAILSLVTGQHGSDVILNCTFPYEPIDTLPLKVLWQKINSNSADQVVHNYYHQRDQLDQQDEAYRNRTQMFPEEFRKGNASLKLMRVRPEDEGRYTCYVWKKNGSVYYNVDFVVTESKAIWNHHSRIPLAFPLAVVVLIVMF